MVLLRQRDALSWQMLIKEEKKYLLNAAILNLGIERKHHRLIQHIFQIINIVWN